MKIWFYFLLNVILTTLKLFRPGGTKALVSENLILKQQLLTMKKKMKRSPRLSASERTIYGLLTSIISKNRLSKIAVIISPATLLAFHKALIKRKYQRLFSNKYPKKPGPKGPSPELIALILEIKKRNPRFGCRRIAMQITNDFSFDIDKDVVRRVLAKYYKPSAGNDGPSWLTFIGHATDSLWSIDFFRCESIHLRSHRVMVVMDQFTRRIIGFAVHKGDLHGVAICCMFNKIIRDQPLPKYLSSDNDPLFKFHRWKANLWVLDVKEIKSIPQQPRSHPFIERLIKSVRVEVLERSFFWNENDLRRKLDHFKTYFNESRSHMGLNGSIPNNIKQNKKADIIDINNFRWKRHCRGLFQLPVAA